LSNCNRDVSFQTEDPIDTLAWNGSDLVAISVDNLPRVDALPGSYGDVVLLEKCDEVPDGAEHC